MCVHVLQLCLSIRKSEVCRCSNAIRVYVLKLVLMMLIRIFMNCYVYFDDVLWICLHILYYLKHMFNMGNHQTFKSGSISDKLAYGSLCVAFSFVFPPRKLMRTYEILSCVFCVFVCLQPHPPKTQTRVVKRPCFSYTRRYQYKYQH
jgi:hypothetical protein